ncbi:MAG TPA: hypothetical protein VJW76_01170 [Verrucomicrobiae bacterium]|nr:hypothetical protein [Verrucomicrobiae bacterium]
MILESEANRRRLESEWQHLRAATSWMGEARRLGQKARPWWPLVASLAGFLAVRGFRKSSPLLNRTGSILSLITTALSLWKQTRAKPGEEKSEAF